MYARKPLFSIVRILTMDIALISVYAAASNNLLGATMTFMTWSGPCVCSMLPNENLRARSVLDCLIAKRSPGEIQIKLWNLWIQKVNCGTETDLNLPKVNCVTDMRVWSTRFCVSKSLILCAMYYTRPRLFWDTHVTQLVFPESHGDAMNCCKA